MPKLSFYTIFSVTFRYNFYPHSALNALYQNEESVFIDACCNNRVTENFLRKLGTSLYLFFLFLKRKLFSFEHSEILTVSIMM